MDSAASSLALIFHPCFELFNQKLASLQQKKHFYAEIFYESHRRCFLILPPLVKLFLAGSPNIFNILHKLACGKISLQILLVPSKHSVILFYIILLLWITEGLSPQKKQPVIYLDNQLSQAFSRGRTQQRGLRERHQFLPTFSQHEV